MAGPAPDEPQRDPRPASLRIAEDAVARMVVSEAPWPAAATVVVAVSGGADSLCLLGTLVALRDMRHPNAPGDLVVATLDHGMRGQTGAEDARWVQTLAEGLGLRCVVEHADTLARARSAHLSPEDAARRVRYAFLRRVAREVGAARICVGHTLDDQAETVLLRLLRGSGLDGLSGMRPVRGDLARPLLNLTHAQSVAYCAARGWLPREDLTNRDERYLRNRVRRRLLPLLEAYNPNVRRTLARNAAYIADDQAFLEAATDVSWAAAVTEATPTRVALRLPALREAAPALRRRLLRRAVAMLRDAAADDAGGLGLEARHVALIERFLTSGRTGRALTLSNGLRARLDYDTLTLLCVTPATPAATEPDAASEWTLTIPGVAEAAPLGWRVRAAALTTPPGLEGDALPPIPREPPAPHAGTAAAIHRAELRVYVDAERLPDTLSVRAWRPGDRMRPLGMARDKKLQDVFSDAKVPREARHRLPLVCAGDRIVWVAGVRLADDYKLSQATRSIVALQAEPLSAETEESET